MPLRRIRAGLQAVPPSDPAATHGARSSFGNQILGWLYEAKFARKDTLEVVEDKEDHFVVQVYTDRHRYRIYADPRGMGCIGYNRAPVPGEDHIRMSDLSDGDVSERAFRLILSDILSMELNTVEPRAFSRSLEKAPA